MSSLPLCTMEPGVIGRGREGIGSQSDSILALTLPSLCVVHVHETPFTVSFSTTGLKRLGTSWEPRALGL